MPGRHVAAVLVLARLAAALLIRVGTGPDSAAEAVPETVVASAATDAAVVLAAPRTGRPFLLTALALVAALLLVTAPLTDRTVEVSTPGRPALLLRSARSLRAPPRHRST
jgi:hypothetical protein